MTMTPETWKTLVTTVEKMPTCPSWLRQQAELNWAAVSQLPVVDVTSNGQHAAPMIEQKVVAPDYLSFLREQIELGTRGREWSDVLRKRLTALEPFVGKQLIVATFYCKPHSATLRINPETNALVHVEVN